ncbi:hypothetical protein DKL61_15355 [Gammaproteobacteria bacterium ESL0073]|nr:hypothetical protein DKL61_15355 [Gammaproteobacteria bacterium ESL0073]
MKKLIPALLFTTSIPLLVMAEPPEAHNSSAPMPCGMSGPGTHMQSPMRMGPHAAGIQHMTPEQHAKMQEIMQEQHKKRQDITKKYLDKLSDSEKKAMRDELNQTREETSKAIRAILTPEQQKTFDENKKRRDERMKEWQEFQDWKANKAKN